MCGSHLTQTFSPLGRCLPASGKNLSNLRNIALKPKLRQTGLAY